MKKFFCFLFIISLQLSLYSSQTKILTLSNFISLVLKKNLNIKSYLLNKKIYKYNIEKYIAEFDTNLGLNINKSYQKEFTGSALQSETSKYYISKNNNWDLSLSKKFYTGTVATLSFTNNRFETNSNWSILNPSYSSLLQLNIEQPILKGAGITINKSEIIKAENSLKATEFDVKNYINNIILNASYKFFDLLYAYKNYQAMQESLQLAKEILKIDKRKLSVGLISKDLIKQSEAEVAARKENVIKAYQDLLNVSDELKKYYNDLLSDYIIKPEYIINVNPIKTTLKKSINEALKKRYEIKEINQQIKNADIDIKKAKNNLLPQLDLNIYGGISGKGEDYSNNIHRMKTGEYREWGIGLELKFPIGNRENKANYKIASLNKQQLIFNKKDLENQIILEVKKSYRNLVTLQKKINANKKSLKATILKLKIEEKRYKHGLSTPFEVFSYQNDYTNQKLKLIQSEIDYAKEILNFKKLTGNNLFTIKNN